MNIILEPNQEHDLKLSSEDLVLIINELAKLPYGEVRGTIEKIVEQTNYKK